MILIGISGRKASGKTALANFLMENKNKLFGEPYYLSNFKYGEDIGSVQSFRTVNAKRYAFAGKLKKFCMDYLGLTHEQCYGTDEQKNTLTKLVWEKQTFYDAMMGKWFNEADGLAKKHYDRLIAEEPRATFSAMVYYWVDEIKKTGLMTAREVMQCYGTEFFRKIDDEYHLNGLKEQLDNDSVEVAFVDDLRFANEVDAITNWGGIAIRLTRFTDIGDTHQSEIDLDNYTGFNFTLDNANMTIEESRINLAKLLKEHGVIKNEISYLQG